MLTNNSKTASTCLYYYPLFVNKKRKSHQLIGHGKLGMYCIGNQIIVPSDFIETQISLHEEEFILTICRGEAKHVIQYSVPIRKNRM